MLIKRDKKSQKNLWRAIVSVAIGVVLLWLKKFPKDENAVDFLEILGFGFCFLAVWFYYKSLKFSMEIILKPALKKVFDRVKTSWKNTVRKIKKKLGISENNWRMKGTDSLSFSFPSWGKKKGKNRDFGKDRIKWNEEPNNPWKIRYIYTKYIVKRVKKGMTFKGSNTALENENIVGECPYPQIFRLYTVSRYAPSQISNSAVSDEMVEEAMEKLIK